MIERLPRHGRHAVFAPAVKVGGRAFLGGVMATDWETGLLPSARPAPGFRFHHRPLAAQSEVVLDELERTLGALGMAASSVVQLTQWVAPGAGITPWMEARARRLPDGGFASIAAGAPRLPVAGAALCVDAVACEGAERVAVAPAGRPFPAGVRVGGMVHLSGELATDWRSQDGSAVAAEARVDPRFWYGEPVRAQAEAILRRLARSAAEAGADLARTARAAVFLADPAQVGVLDDVWRSWFGEAPPARTVITGCELAAQGCVVEIAVDVLAGEAPAPVAVPDLAQPGHEAAAIVADGLVYVSGQMAVGPDGIDVRGLPDPVFGDLRVPVAEQLALVLDRVDRVLRAAGGGLDDVVSARLYLPDLRLLGAALGPWAAAFGDAPPAGSAVGVGPLTVPGGLVMMDAIARAR